MGRLDRQQTRMTVTPIAPDLYQIIVPTPFPVGPVNVYLAAGPNEPLTLIDTGPRTDQARAALEQALAVLGYALADIERIIITHGHTDHYGLAGDIVQVSKAHVHSHPRNRLLIEDYAAERERRSSFFRDLLTEAGVPPDVWTTVVQVLEALRHFATAVSPVCSLDEGDELRLAGQIWQVLFMPGHAAGLICFYQPETRLFLSNDHLLRDISSNPLFEPPLPGQTRRRRSLVDYIASLERTAALSISTAWPGHGEPVHDHRNLIQDRLAFHHRRADRIVAALNDGAQSVYALSQLIFSDLNPMDHFLAISEVLAHLEWLEDRGVVTSWPQNHLVLWATSEEQPARIDGCSVR
jgi:glyoxylase-like metal-dependent hydrolase (beta-lactamase superfamily II)